MKWYMFIILALLVLVLIISSLRIWLLYRQITPLHTYWQKQNTETVADALVYVALGDSAAQGLGASSPAKSYVGLIAEALAKQQNRPVKIVNLSKSGAKIKDVLDTQLPQFKQLALPDDAAITIEIGANDMGSFDQAAFSSQFDQLLAALPKQTVVANMPYFGGGIFRSRERNVQTINPVIERLTKSAGLRQANLYQATKDNDSWRTYAADGFHPNNRGYEGWYRAFWNELSR
jgi:lysophospholipase L1-like esterase